MGQHTFSKKRFPFNGLWELQSLPLLFALRYNAPNVSPFLRSLVISFSSCSQCNFYSRAISSWKIVSFGFCQPRKRPPSLTINGQICTKDSLLNLIKLSSGIGRSHVLYFGGKILTLARKMYLCWIDFGIRIELHLSFWNKVRESSRYQLTISTGLETNRLYKSSRYFFFLPFPLSLFLPKYGKRDHVRWPKLFLCQLTNKRFISDFGIL